MVIYKTAVYPYNEYMYPLVFNSDLIETIEINQLIAFEGSGIENTEVVDFKGEKYTINTDIDYSKCEVILLNLFELDEKSYPQIIDLFETLPDKDIKILADITTYKNIIDELKPYYSGPWIDFNELNKNINYISINKEDEKITFAVFKRKEFKPINSSVVGICSTNENCMKFDAMLSAIRYFKAQDYKVAGIGSKDYSELFGLFSFQKELLSENLTTFEIVCKFMKIMNYIDKELSPDIIFFAVPGGILPINSKHHGDYGILATQIFSVLKCDQLVLNLGYSSDYNDEFLLELSNICKYKLNNNVSHFGLSNKMIFPQSLNEKEISYFDVANVDNNIKIIKNSDYSVFNISDTTGIRSLAESLEKNLLRMGNSILM